MPHNISARAGHLPKARSRRRRVISAVEPDEPASNFQQRDGVDGARTVDAWAQHALCVVHKGPGGQLGKMANHAGRRLKAAPTQRRRALSSRHENRQAERKDAWQAQQ
jgi:hypothetical protein